MTGKYAIAFPFASAPRANGSTRRDRVGALDVLALAAAVLAL